MLSERIGFQRLHWQNMFLSHDTSFLQVVQLRQEVIGLMSGQLIVSARPKIDTWPYKFILNTSKIAVFLAELHYFRELLAENL